MSVVAPKYRGTKEFFLVYMELIAAARHRGTMTYQEVADIMGLPLRGSHMGKEVGYMLGEISDDEIGYGRPMLSALAISVSGHPGPGFFAFAKQLGKLQDDSEAAKDRFWEQQKQAVYAAWQKNFKAAS